MAGAPQILEDLGARLRARSRGNASEGHTVLNVVSAERSTLTAIPEVVP
jgi:hypothetical protein